MTLKKMKSNGSNVMNFVKDVQDFLYLLQIINLLIPTASNVMIDTSKMEKIALTV